MVLNTCLLLSDMRLDLSDGKEDPLSLVSTKFLLLNLVPKIFYGKICRFCAPRPECNIALRRSKRCVFKEFTLLTGHQRQILI